MPFEGHHNEQIYQNHLDPELKSRNFYSHQKILVFPNICEFHPLLLQISFSFDLQIIIFIIRVESNITKVEVIIIKQGIVKIEWGKGCFVIIFS